MVNVSRQLRCRLCDDNLDAATAPMHLRWVHQVLPGEHTIVDVPVGRTDVRRKTPVETGDREQETHLAIAVL